MFTAITTWFQIGFAGLWPLLWKFGLSGVICLGLVAAYFFMPAPVALLFPNLRKWLLPAAAVLAISIVSYAVGVADEHNRGVEQNRVASNAAYEQGRRASENAQSSVDKSDRLDAGRLDRCGLPTQRRDAYDRFQPRAKSKDLPANCL